jgi:hypothetical protein
MTNGKPREIGRDTLDALRRIGLGGESRDAIEAGISSLSCGFDLDPVHRYELASLASAEISSDHGYGLTESGQEAIRELLNAADPGWSVDWRCIPKVRRGSEFRAEYDLAVAAEGEALRTVSRFERELRTARELARQASEARLVVMAREGEARRSADSPPSCGHPAPGVDAGELASLRAMVARLEVWKLELRGCRFAGGDGTSVAAELGTRMRGTRDGDPEVAGSSSGSDLGDGMRGEYDFTGGFRGLFFSGGIDALRDLISKVCAWAGLESNRFDDDQDPALDSPAQRVVRALHRWQALLGVSPGGLIGGPVAFGSEGPGIRNTVRVHLDRIEASCRDAISRAGSLVPRVVISADVLHALVWHVDTVRRCLASHPGLSPVDHLAEIAGIVNRGTIVSGPGNVDADGEVIEVYDQGRILDLERVARSRAEDLEASSRRIADLEERSRAHAEDCEWSGAIEAAYLRRFLAILD